MDARHCLIGGGYVMPVHLHNHVPGLQACLCSWTPWTNILDGCPFYSIRDVELLPHIRRQIGHCQTQLATLARGVAPVVVIVGNLPIAMELTHGQIDGLRSAFAHDAKM